MIEVPDSAHFGCNSETCKDRWIDHTFRIGEVHEHENGEISDIEHADLIQSTLKQTRSSRSMAGPSKVDDTDRIDP